MYHCFLIIFIKILRLFTKNLIIFGQGINKSHPYIYPILDSILNNDVKNFKTNFNKMIGHCLGLYGKNLFSFTNSIENQTINYEKNI